MVSRSKSAPIAKSDARHGNALQVLVVHGPNLNLLGEREPAVYGSTTLAISTRQLQELARELGLALETFQSNSEGAHRRSYSGGARTNRRC